MALLNIVCLLNTHYVQLTVLSSVEETKSIQTRFLLSRSLSSVWVDRWHTHGAALGWYRLVVFHAMRMLRWQTLFLMGGLEKVDGQCDFRARP